MLAVRDLLAESGYAALTTAAVARRAGVSTATLYRRWPTKRELVLASTRRMIETGVADEAVDSGAATAEGFDTGSLRGDLQAFIAHKNRALSGATGQAVLSLLGELPQDPELKELLLGELLAATRSHLEQIRDRARARGEGAPIWILTPEPDWFWERSSPGLPSRPAVTAASRCLTSSGACCCGLSVAGDVVWRAAGGCRPFIGGDVLRGRGQEYRHCRPRPCGG